MTATVDIDVTHGGSAGLPFDAIEAANAAKRESVHLAVRLTARPATGVQIAALLRRPIVQARLQGIADLRPNIGAATVTAGLMRRPLVIASLSGSAT